jgi:hypothetical protein
MQISVRLAPMGGETLLRRVTFHITRTCPYQLNVARNQANFGWRALSPIL